MPASPNLKYKQLYCFEKTNGVAIVGFAGHIRKDKQVYREVEHKSFMRLGL